MKDIVIEVKKFKEELSKASSDCWVKGEDRRIYGIELSRLLEVAFDCLIETEGGWGSGLGIFGTLYNNLYQKGFKKLRYTTEKELYNKACNFDDSAISGSEKKVLNALIGLSANYRWDLYLALSEFIDGFLW